MSPVSTSITPLALSNDIFHPEWWETEGQSVTEQSIITRMRAMGANDSKPIKISPTLPAALKCNEDSGGLLESGSCYFYVVRVFLVLYRLSSYWPDSWIIKLGATGSLGALFSASKHLFV